VFDDFANRVDSCYGRERESVREWKSTFQTDVFQTVKEQEAKAVTTYKSDRDGALQAVTDLSNGLAERVLHETKERLLAMKSYKP